MPSPECGRNSQSSTWILADPSIDWRADGKRSGVASCAGTSDARTAYASLPKSTEYRSASSLRRSSPEPKVFERWPYGHIYDAFVEGAHRNRGVGESLVNAALEWCRARRVDRVELYTHARNDLGMRFWQRMGFETTVHILDRRIRPLGSVRNNLNQG